VGLEPESARAIFLAIAKFFAKQPAAKNEKIISSSEMKCPTSGVFITNYWGSVRLSGQVR